MWAARTSSGAAWWRSRSCPAGETLRTSGSLPMAPRGFADQPPAPVASTSGSNHFGVCSGLVDKDELAGIEACLIVFPPLTRLRRVGRSCSAACSVFLKLIPCPRERGPGSTPNWAENGSPRLLLSTSSFGSCICLAAQGLSTGSLVLPMCRLTWPGPSRLPWKDRWDPAWIGPRSARSWRRGGEPIDTQGEPSNLGRRQRRNLVFNRPLVQHRGLRAQDAQVAKNRNDGNESRARTSRRSTLNGSRWRLAPSSNLDVRVLRIPGL